MIGTSHQSSGMRGDFAILILLFLRGCRPEIIVDQNPCKSDFEPIFWKCFNADNFYFYADWRISNNFFHFVTFEKSRTTCPFNGNEASRLSYLTGLLTKLPGDHIPFEKSSCLLCKSLSEAFVIVLAWLNQATADPIRRCLRSPFKIAFFSPLFEEMRIKNTAF